jgi:hypothetical protein
MPSHMLTLKQYLRARSMAMSVIEIFGYIEIENDASGLQYRFSRQYRSLKPPI